jgi:hypothetical protein
LTVPLEEAPANYVPAAAVRRRGQALSGIIGRKALVGGSISPQRKTRAQLGDGVDTIDLEAIRG